MLVGAFCSDLLEGRDVGSAVFKTNNEQGVIGSKENEVGEQATCSAVTIAEGMQIFVRITGTGF